MDTQDFIDSGVIELYAAGGLSEPEMAEVENQALQHPAVKAALENALRAIEAYALTHAQTPSFKLDEQILATLSARPSAEQYQEERPVAQTIPFPDTSTQEFSFQKQWKWAASLLLVISAIANIYLYRQVQEKEQELVASRQQTRQYVYQTNQLEQKSFQSENLVQVLTDPQTKSIALKAVDQKNSASGKVFWNQETKDVFFNPRNLPPIPAGTQYQLWALLDGKPIDAGVIALANLDVQQMKAIEQAQAFAVTLEPMGGSASPTLSNLVVSGTI